MKSNMASHVFYNHAFNTTNAEKDLFLTQTSVAGGFELKSLADEQPKELTYKVVPTDNGVSSEFLQWNSLSMAQSQRLLSTIDWGRNAFNTRVMRKPIVFSPEYQAHVAGRLGLVISETLQMVTCVVSDQPIQNSMQPAAHLKLIPPPELISETSMHIMAAFYRKGNVEVPASLSCPALRELVKCHAPLQKKLGFQLFNPELFNEKGVLLIPRNVIEEISQS